MTLRSLADSIVSLFYPSLCAICGEPLRGREEHLCLRCFLDLPKTNYLFLTDNQAVERFSGKIPVVKAAAWLYYNKGGITQKLVEEIKYHGNIGLGEWTGAQMARGAIGFFEGIDLLTPVPLHSSKERKRGFNQAEAIAKGVSAVTNIPVLAKNLRRTRANPSQTTKGLFERWKNTTGLFETVNPDLFENKHLLIIDDVLTSGSTIESVARAALVAKGARISVLTVGMT
jgi:predicted amidophosphoribosyltransferase